MANNRSKVISGIISCYTNPIINYGKKMMDCNKLVAQNRKLIDHNTQLESENKQLASFNRTVVEEIAEAKTSLGACKKSLMFYETHQINAFEHYLENEDDPANVAPAFRDAYCLFLVSMATNNKNTARKNKYILRYIFSQKALVEDFKKSLRRTKLTAEKKPLKSRSAPR